MEDPRLSPNFHLSELIFSETASRLKIDNTPSESAIENLRSLCENVLQPVRNRYNKPVVISSGFRCGKLNSLIPGSSRRSQHILGQAADFHIPGVENFEVASWIAKNLTFDQCILEYWTGGKTGWVHCSYSLYNKNEILTINKNGKFSGFRIC